MYIKVLSNVRGVGRPRDDDYAALTVPTQDHLRHRHAARLGDDSELGICEQLIVVATPAERIPTLDNDTQASVMKIDRSSSIRRRTISSL